MFSCFSLRCRHAALLRCFARVTVSPSCRGAVLWPLCCFVCCGAVSLCALDCVAVLLCCCCVAVVRCCCVVLPCRCERFRVFADAVCRCVSMVLVLRCPTAGHSPSALHCILLPLPRHVRSVCCPCSCSLMDHSLTLFHTLRNLKALLSHQHSSSPAAFSWPSVHCVPLLFGFPVPVVLQLLALTLLSCVLAPPVCSLCSSALPELVVRGQGQGQNLLAVHFLLWRCLECLRLGAEAPVTQRSVCRRHFGGSCTYSVALPLCC
jgi:hypothetical protein